MNATDEIENARYIREKVKEILINNNNILVGVNITDIQFWLLEEYGYDLSKNELITIRQEASKLTMNEYKKQYNKSIIGKGLKYDLSL